MPSKKKESAEQRTEYVGLWLSKEEKEDALLIASSENFSSLSQFIRHRCITEKITNSEVTDMLMKLVSIKFLEEYLKYYPKEEKKEYTEKDLIRPCIIAGSPPVNVSIKKIDEGRKSTRDCYVGFWVTSQEKMELKENAHIAAFSTVAKYVRNRCLREQIAKEKIIDIFLSFISTEISKGIISGNYADKNLDWRKKKVKEKSRDDFTARLSSITIGMDEKQRNHFLNTVKELSEVYTTDLQDELNSILILQKRRIESSLAQIKRAEVIT